MTEEPLPEQNPILPNLSPDEVASARALDRELRRTRNEAVRWTNAHNSVQAEAQLFVDELDDKYHYVEKGLALDFPKAKFVPRPPAPQEPARRPLPVALPRPASAPPPGRSVNPHAPLRKGPTSR